MDPTSSRLTTFLQSQGIDSIETFTTLLKSNQITLNWTPVGESLSQPGLGFQNATITPAGRGRGQGGQGQNPQNRRASQPPLGTPIQPGVAPLQNQGGQVPPGQKRGGPGPLQGPPPVQGPTPSGQSPGQRGSPVPVRHGSGSQGNPNFQNPNLPPNPNFNPNFRGGPQFQPGMGPGGPRGGPGMGPGMGPGGRGGPQQQRRGLTQSMPGAVGGPKVVSQGLPLSNSVPGLGPGGRGRGGVIPAQPALQQTSEVHSDNPY